MNSHIELQKATMVDVKDFKNRVEAEISQVYKVEFLGDSFEEIVRSLTETKAEKIYSWIKEILAKKIQPIVTGSKKEYKDWQINELLTFRYPFSINNTEYRILFVKVKNSFYIEFHLGDHKYYDTVRKDLLSQ
ncbi:hypothetical protein HZA98_01825 [Candidatus Woesearchaeota archaeon]|nr:hypothetical protein [Candidatus Woesearchaeota archaeon]